MEEDGEPVVDQNYFKHTVAKAILWRTAEKLFDTLELDGYRANSVAYAMAWLADQSERCIDLDRVWNEQRITPALCDAFKAVCAAAHKHINSQDGNQGEASKRESCWTKFREKHLSEPKEWRVELSGRAFVAAATEDESLAIEWERVRHGFINDSRTIGELEALTGKSWMSSRRQEPVYFYADMKWEKLRKMRNMGLKKIRGLVEIFSTASVC